MTDRLKDQIAKTTDRLATLKARKMLADARQAAKERADARRADAHKKITLGGIVIAADLGEWDAAEVCGLLLLARDQCLARSDGRDLARQRGAAHLAAREAERAARKA